MRDTKNFLSWLGWVGLAMGASGCGNALNCAINGDNVRGHVLFGQAAQVDAGARVVVEWSKDGFGAVDGLDTIDNAQGLVSVPYSLCVDNNIEVSIRAYQDENGNGAWESGEAAGRDDGTSDGNATYTTHNLAGAEPSGDASGNWEVEKDVNVWLDGSTSQ
jgi:hypothetical protein